METWATRHPSLTERCLTCSSRASCYWVLLTHACRKTTCCSSWQCAPVSVLHRETTSGVHSSSSLQHPRSTTGTRNLPVLCPNSRWGSDTAERLLFLSLVNASEPRFHNHPLGGSLVYLMQDNRAVHIYVRVKLMFFRKNIFGRQCVSDACVFKLQITCQTHQNSSFSWVHIIISMHLCCARFLTWSIFSASLEINQF